MAQYKVLETSFINNAIVEVDAVIEYDGEASENLELIVPDEPAAKSKAKPADPSA